MKNYNVIKMVWVFHICLLLLVLQSGAGAATGNKIYVAKLGSDQTGTGAIDSPYLSINKAIKIATTPDTIVVNEGVYTERIELLNKSLIIKSLQGPQLTEINGNNEYSVIKVSGGSLHLEGFTIKDGYTNSFGGGIIAASADLTITNCIFMHNRAETYQWSRGGALVFTNADSALNNRVVISNCRFDGNYASNYGGALAFKTSFSNAAGVDVLIKDCYFYNNQAGAVGSYIIQEYNKNFEVTCVVLSGLHCTFTIENCDFSGAAKTDDAVTLFCYGKASGTISNCLFTHEPAVTPGDSLVHRAIHVANKTRVDILNCTLINHAHDEYPNLLVSGGGNARVLNSILWGNDWQIELQNVNGLGGNLYIDYSDVQNNIQSVTTSQFSLLDWQEHNITGDPLFCNPDSGDYSLRAGSPCLNAGENGVTIGKYGQGCHTNIIENDRTDRYDLELANYPNPFNHSTSLQFTSPAPGYLTVNIYDLQGRLVRSLLNDYVQSGRNAVIWNGADNNNIQTTSGVYFGVLQCAGQRQVIKMVYVR
ncbi:MAG TPA: T9SS type A sorting domain-containing protein [bacterium]|nr:T9SS type A sorting domain-containing protein [bacterium]HPN44721.1 T9SS type A sorting domain-containing protein [bacterium]